MFKKTVVSMPIAEVTSSTITGFLAECLPLEAATNDLPPKPRFGSFLKTDSQGIAIFAVAYNVVTGPQDSIHRPSALGLTREELRLEQPHIFSLLRTEVQALIVGYSAGTKVYQHLPPHPPDVHDFVHQATADEVRELTGDFEFLRLLSNVSAIPPDELIAATIREANATLG